MSCAGREFLTQLVGHEGIRLHPLAKLVGLTAHQHRHVEGSGHQGDLRRPHAGHHVPVGQQSVGAQEHLGHLRGPDSTKR